MLNFNCDRVQGQTIRSVLGSERQVVSDGSLEYAQIVFQLETAFLRISVDQDSDELRISLEDETQPLPGEFVAIPELEVCVGETVGWCWEGRNSQGYYDSFSISVSGIHPDFCFVGIASSIELNRVSKIGPAVDDKQMPAEVMTALKAE